MTATTTASRQPIARKRPQRPRWAIPAVILVVSMLAFMVSPYIPPDIAASRIDVHGDRVHYWLLVGHIGFAAIAVLTGVAQFWPRLRTRYPRAHRWTGRTYFFAGIFPSMLFGIPVTLMGSGGISIMVANATLLAIWAVTGITGLRAILGRRFGEHRDWMIRSYAATLTSLTSRVTGTIMLLAVAPRLNTATYNGNEEAMIRDGAGTGAWLAVLVNVVAAEAIVQRRRTRTRPASPTLMQAGATPATFEQR